MVKCNRALTFGEYAAVVAAVNADGTYTVDWNDGDCTEPHTHTHTHTHTHMYAGRTAALGSREGGGPGALIRRGVGGDGEVQVRNHGQVARQLYTCIRSHCGKVT